MRPGAFYVVLAICLDFVPYFLCISSFFIYFTNAEKMFLNCD